MIKEIVKDKFLLGQKSTDATKDDMNIIADLKDTIDTHKTHCVGMAANMIGYAKRILIFLDVDGAYKIMVNPQILSKSGEYRTKEGCLSHTGERDCVRYNKIKVQYLDEDFKIKIKTYSSFTAEIIQHEMEHFEGILI